ncbi:MAG: hypothetical protein ACHQIM_17185 [Sphingobacteriales bacterium]
MEKSSIRKLQELLAQQFTKFLSVELNSVNILIMPLRDDIPIIAKAHFNKEADSLTITFKDLIPLDISFGDDDVIHFLKTNDNCIRGFEVKGVSHIKAGKSKSHGYIYSGKSGDFKSSLEVDSYSFKKRTADFMKDLSKADLKELQVTGR